MGGFFQVFCSFFSGILTALALPNELFHFGSAVFGMAALAPLYIAAKSAKSYKNAAALFALDALTTHLLSSFWLANFKDFAVFTLGASALGTACIEAMAGCLFFAPFAQSAEALQKKNRLQAIPFMRTFPLTQKSPFAISFVQKLRRNVSFDFSSPEFRVFWFACTRVVYEWAKSTGFLAYPWGTLSMSAFRAKPLMQSADIFGAYGITFLFAFIAGTLAESVLSFGKKNRGAKIAGLQKCALALLACFFLYGAFCLCQSRTILKTMNAVLIQQNRDPWAVRGDDDAIRVSMELSQNGIDEFAQRGKKADIVVWSEAVLRHAFPESYIRYTVRPDEEPLIGFIRRTQIPFLIGGSYVLDEEKEQVANAAMMFDRDGFLRGFYGKTHLVPFAEVIPGIEFPIVKKIMGRVVGISNGWNPGNEFVLFDLGISSEEKKPFPSFSVIDMEKPISAYGTSARARLATPICFEDAFPDICGPFHDMGAEVFLNITDDSWSKTASAEYQHFVVAAFRAIEYRTTLVRSTNSGFTAVVDPAGNIVQSAPLFEEAYLCAEIPIYQWRETVHSRYTNWFVHLILVFMAAMLFIVASEFVRQPKHSKQYIQEA